MNVFNEEQGLISNFINDIFAYKNELWCATNSGISRFKNGRTISIDRKDGIPSTEVNVIWSNENKVIFGTKKGLAFLNKRYFERKKRLLNVEVIQVKLGDKNLHFQKDPPILPSEKNGISILLKAVDFRIENPINYKYRLSNEKNWLYTTQPN